MKGTHHASSLIVEEHLKKVLSKTGGQTYKASDNKLLPKPLHSVFGNFPASQMPKKVTRVEPVKPLDQEMQKAAATSVRKLQNLF